MPVAFCVDEGFTDHAAVTLISIIRTNPQWYFDFYLISSDLHPTKSEKLKNLCSKHKCFLHVLKPDFRVFADFPQVHHLKLSAYYRLLAPDLIQSDFILYLDSDIVCASDLSPFLQINLNNQVLAAVPDPIYKWHSDLGMDSDATYFNSGVMRIDTQAWHKAKIFSRVSEFIRTYPEKIRFADQCALNAVLNGDFFALPPKFNQQSILLREDFDSSRVSWTKEEVREAIDHPLLIHFTGPSKPWQYNNSHPSKELYWYYQKSSPFKRRFPEGMKPLDYIKFFVPHRVKKFLKGA
ncbi:glycosyltransferase family 8 protein [Algoriphagus namhaensis]